MFYKSEGNKEFQLKNYNTSVKLYTKSAIYAPSGSIDLPVAIANRSAALFYLERWQVSKGIKLYSKIIIYKCTFAFYSLVIYIYLICNLFCKYLKIIKLYL